MKFWSRRNQTLKVILFSLLVGLIGMGIFVSSALAQEVTPAAAEPKDCQSCHVDVAKALNASPHAHAYSSEDFQGRWKGLGEPGACLVCHTTGYQATTGEYHAEGVTCAACHGAFQEGHPPALVPVRASSDYCGACHTVTLSEWRLTGHASAGVGCNNCHNPHSQQVRFENPDEMCINCHKDDLGEHKDDLHIQKGIGCVDCHALVLPPDTPPQDGLAPTGHTFTITPSTCVACHTDILKTGKPLPGYEAGAKAVAASGVITSTVPAVLDHYINRAQVTQITVEQENQVLKATLASIRLSTLFQGGLVGLVLGGTTAYFFAYNMRKDPDDEQEAGQDADVAGDGTHEKE